MDSNDFATVADCQGVPAFESQLGDAPPGTKCISGMNWCCRANATRIWAAVILLVLVCCVLPAFCCVFVKEDGWWKKRQIRLMRAELGQQTLELQQQYTPPIV